MTPKKTLLAVSLAALFAGCGDGSTGGSDPEGSSSESSGANTMTDPRDGKTYATVVIGDQIWMAENLDYDYEADGGSYGSFCYNDSSAYCEKYGRLYSWAAAMDTLTTGCGDGKTCAATAPVQGICPEGWRLPSVEDWESLFAFIGSSGAEGAALKSKESWNDYGLNSGNGWDVFGFSALAAGNRDVTVEHDYHNLGIDAYFWTSSEANGSTGRYVSLHHKDSKATLWTVGKYMVAYSVRCVMDVGETGRSSSKEGSSASRSSARPSSSSSESVPDTGTTTDARDGKTYRTVAIAGKTWMAENLDYEASGSFCYNDTAAYCERYGRLYTWGAAMDSLTTGCGDGKTCSVSRPRGICPEGWHLPDNAEWTDFISAVGGSDEAGNALKSAESWNDWNGKSGGGADTYGFSAMAAGNRDVTVEHDYHNLGIDAYFWTSSEAGATTAYYVSVHHKDKKTIQWTVEKYMVAYSVRCLKD